MKAPLQFESYEEKIERIGIDETLRQARREADKYAYTYGRDGFYLEFSRVYMHLHSLGLWPSIEKWNPDFLEKLKKIGEEPINRG